MITTRVFRYKSAARFFASLLFDILSVSPLILILGNLLPPFILKVHHLVLGIAFLLGVIFLSFLRSGQVYLILVVAFNTVQYSMNGFLHIADVFDAFFGPTILLCAIYTLKTEIIKWESLRSKVQVFLWLSLIPVVIGVLQYFHIIPLNILSANYVNFAQTSEGYIPRINGYFYHGNELVIISYFLFLNLAFGRSFFRGLVWLILLILFAVLTRYKSLVATSVLVTLYYIFTINPHSAKVLKSIPTWIYLSTAFVFTCSVIFFVYNHIQHNLSTIGSPFEQTLLTGRGGIWSVYISSIESYSAMQHLFGGGIGTEAAQFGQHMTPKTFYPLERNPQTNLRPHPHNPWLSYYVTIGLVGILFVIMILRKWATAFLAQKPSMLSKAYGFALLILPYLTFGVTIMITDMSIYWICLSFSLLNICQHQISLQQK